MSTDFLALDFQDVKQPPVNPLDRREFLGRLGAGIIIFISLGDLLEAAEQARGQRAGGRGGGMPSDFNAFLRIGEDGRVTLFTGKVEMGQGPITSLPQMLAEELEVPVESVDIVMGDTDLCPWDMGTFGSMTTRFFGPPLRAAAAEAKAVLLQLGAEKLKLPETQLLARDAAVFSKTDNQRKVTYAELAKGQRIERHLDGKPTLKQPGDFRVIGKSLNRRDALEKVTGKAQYAGDLRLPGMLYAKVLRPPAHGARLRSANTESCDQLPGARVVREGEFIAVLHELPDMAEAARDKIKAEWELPSAGPDDKSIFDHLLKANPQPRVAAQGGALADGQKLATRSFKSTYLNSYVAHASMETHTALARFEGGRVTVWASTQNPFGAKREIAEALEVPAQNVRMITPFVGGGFGGKTQNSQAVEAARLAKATGKPVQVCRTRAEEFFQDSFRPAAVVTISSGVDASGKIVFWDYDVAFAGERGSQQFYAIPHHRTVARPSSWSSEAHPFATGAWRAPANNTNSFARECQIDLMAAAAGIDPVEFRVKNLSDQKMIRVLKAAAERFGWTGAKSPSRRGYGVACGIDAGTSVATIAEVSVDPGTGKVRVKRVVCAQDMGVVINPEGARIQMEGCITMGLGYALTEEVHFRNGKILDTNFDSYELPRFSWLPKIDTVILDSQETPQGGGEPAIIVMGAVIANAIYDATGARLYQLPMTPERVKEVLKKA